MIVCFNTILQFTFYFYNLTKRTLFDIFFQITAKRKKKFRIPISIESKNIRETTGKDSYTKTMTLTGLLN